LNFWLRRNLAAASVAVALVPAREGDVQRCELLVNALPDVGECQYRFPGLLDGFSARSMRSFLSA
jgi:hypothetical protein